MSSYDDQMYASQADMGANSFTGSPNRAMLNPGWGMDPNLLTPSFAAGYRPPWAGTGPGSSYSKPGFFGGLNNLVPWQSYGHTAPQDTWDRSASGVTDSVFSTAAFAVQRIAAPAIAYHVAGKLVGPSSFMGAFRGQGLGASIGQGMGRGFASGVGRGVGLSAVNAGRLGMAAGVAGSAIGSIAAPYAVAQGMMEGAERLAFNPFINTYKTAESFRENYSGVTFTEPGVEGNYSTGRGLSRKQATRMAQGITRAGIQDMAFSTSEYRDIADMSNRSGMLDNAKASQIPGRIKEIAEQVKLVIAISKDPNIQSAMEALAKLQTSGAQGSIASGAYEAIGRNASRAGASIQKVMETVGAQGEYLYRQNGMTGYAGQVAASNEYASFAAAQRMGILSPQQLARMGGVEGATQASLTGQINASNTLFNKMRLYNANFGGGAKGGVISNVSQFGLNMSKDPVGVLANSFMFGEQMIQKDLKNKGNKSTEEQLMELASNMHMLDSNGKLSAEKAGYLLHTQMGMAKPEIMAFLNGRMAETHKDTVSNFAAANESTMRDQLRTYVDREGMYGGSFGKTIKSINTAGRDFTADFVAKSVHPFNEAWAATGDWFHNKAEDWGFGSTITRTGDAQIDEENKMFLDPDHKKQKVVKTDKYELSDDLGTKTAADKEKYGYTFGKDASKYQQLIHNINALAKGGDQTAKDAITAIRNKDTKNVNISNATALAAGSDTGLNTFLMSHDSDLVMRRISEADTSVVKTDRNEVNGDPREINDQIEKAVGKGQSDGLSIIYDAQSLMSQGVQLGTLGKPEFKNRVDRIAKAYGLTNSKDIMAKIESIAKGSSGLASSSTMYASLQAGEKLKDKGLQRQWDDAAKSKNIKKMQWVAEKAVMDLTGSPFDRESTTPDAAIESNRLHDINISEILRKSQNSETGIDFTSFSASTTKLDSAADTLLLAANALLKSQGKDPVDAKTVAPAGNQNTQAFHDIKAGR